MKNDSDLSTSQHILTQSRLYSIDLIFEEISKIIRSLDVNKAHGHDDISVKMLKICDNSLVRPLSLLFEKSFNNYYFPELWKKSNIIPVHKKNDKRKFKNYCPISLLPIFNKVFEKTIFNKMYTFLQNKQLLNPNQSGFRPSDSCIKQLLSMTHEIFQSFNATPPLKIRSVF